MLRNPRQRWYYLGHQRPEEVLLFKNFDSDPDVKAKRGFTYYDEDLRGEKLLNGDRCATYILHPTKD